MYREDGIHAVEEFTAAESALLAAFASDWTGNDSVLIESYQRFRELLRDLEAGACLPNKGC